VTWRRAAVGGLLLAVLALAAFLLRDGIPDVRRMVAAAGVWGPLVYVLLHTVLCAGPIPRSVFTVAAGVLFGSTVGVAASLSGTVLAAILAFGLARVLGGPFVARFAEHRALVWVRERLEHRGFLAMVSLRLIPAVPFSVMNYATALTGVRFPIYVAATLVGVLPGTITTVVLGDAAVGGTPHPAMIVTSVITGTIGIIGAVVVARKRTPPPPVAELPVADADDRPRAA
jgi:uncharacterized membrane protein YdjX (TVP38/TMEM64 family)